MIEKPLNQIRDSEVRDILQHIFTRGEDKQLDLLTETPSLSNVDERSRKLYVSGVTLRLYTRYNDELYYFNFTKV